MAENLPSVTHVQALEGWCLQLSFADGNQCVVDLEQILDFGVFGKLRDPILFRQVKVSFGTLEWPGGIDLDPEWLYQRGVSSKVAEPRSDYNHQ